MKTPFEKGTNSDTDFSVFWTSGTYIEMLLYPTTGVPLAEEPDFRFHGKFNVAGGFNLIFDTNFKHWMRQDLWKWNKKVAAAEAAKKFKHLLVMASSELALPITARWNKVCVATFLVKYPTSKMSWPVNTKSAAAEG